MDIKKAISRGRVILTELRTGTLHGSDPASPLKMARLIESLEGSLSVLEASSRLPLAQRIRDALIEDESDRQRQAAYNSVLDDTYQLNLCLRCACADCAAMSDCCGCEGCLIGSRVVECSKREREGMEVRTFESGVAAIHGEPIIKTEFDRGTRECFVTVRQHSGLERRFKHTL